MASTPGWAAGAVVTVASRRCTQLNVATGEVVGECYERHRHDEFRLFLKKLERQTPRDLALHLIVDNCATHKHPAVQAWLAKHPRVHLRFTPTSAS